MSSPPVIQPPSQRTLLSYERAPPPHTAPHVPAEYHTRPSLPYSPRTERVVDHVLSLLRVDWVRDFLFTADPIQVSVLTSLNVAFAVNAVFQEVSIGRCLSSTDSFPAVVDGETVLVPAFSVGHLSAGVGIKRRVSKVASDQGLLPWLGHLTTEHMRFVADAKNGSYTVIRQSRQLPYAFVEVFEFTSPLHRQRTLLTFHAATLRTIVDQYHPLTFIRRVHDALAMIQIVTEVRECNTCGSALDPHCRCAPVTRTPHHPLDFDVVKSNLMSHFGSFQGAEQLNIHTRDAQVASAELGARFTVIFDHDQTRTQNLIHWAINDRLMAERPSPMRQLIPFSGSASTSPGRDDRDSSDAANDVIYGYFGDLDVVDEHCDDSNDAKLASLPLSSSAVISSDDEADDGGVGKVEHQVEARSISLTAGSSEEAGSAQDSGNTPSVESADRVDAGIAGDAERVGNGVKVQVDAAKMAKVRRRMEKNREAARKSNMSKKLKNEQLKQELGESMDRLAELQDKEAKLRVENSRLRRLVSGN